MFSKLKNIFIGRPLKSSNEGEEENLLTKLQALAMLSSDALSSIAYGPEQVVLVLISVSAGAIWWSLPIGIVVLILLASLTISYRQVIHAYPQGGGAYMVTTENLSPKAGLISGGSLLVDYMLTVAVSVSSGADAITSAIPALHPYYFSAGFNVNESTWFAGICSFSYDSSVFVYRKYCFLDWLWLIAIIAGKFILSCNGSYRKIHLRY